MKSILAELYNGSVYPAEQVCPTDPEYRPVNREIGEIKQYIESKLSEEDKQRFEELENLYCQSAGMESTEIFACGFRLATMIMIEVYSKSAAKDA